MKQPVRFFAIGLLVSSILFLIYYTLFDKPKVVKEEEAVHLSTEEMIAEIENDGFKVVSREEYIAFSLFTEETEGNEQENDANKKDDAANDEDKDNNDEKDESEKDKPDKDDAEDADEKDSTEDDDVITYTFRNEGNVYSQEIVRLLYENDIIDDRQAFADFLEENNYATRIQLGEFTVTNDMTYKEIAEIITTYPGN